MWPAVRGCDHLDFRVNPCATRRLRDPQGQLGGRTVSMGAARECVGDDSFDVYLNAEASKQGDIDAFADDFVTWAPESEEPSRKFDQAKITSLLEVIDTDISCVKVIACPSELLLRRVGAMAR